MRKYFLLGQICSLLLLISSTACFGQANGYFFRCSIRDKAGNLWFGNYGAGVYRYDAVSRGFTNFTKQDGLSDNNIESVYEDKTGNIWFGTENGVCRFDPTTLVSGKSLPAGQSGFTDFSTKEGLSRFHVNCILEDRVGNIWIGSDGWGVFRYNPAADKAGGKSVTNFTKEQGLGSNAVQCILEDKAGNLWFGERAGGVCRYDPSAELRTGSDSGRFIKVNGDGCLSDQIMNILEDKSGNIWFVNLYGGVCQYNGKSFTHLTKENGLCNDTICCMYEDKKGNFWFASDTKWNTGAGGVCRYDGGKSFTRFSTEDGLANSDVFTVVEDNDGIIWIGTRGGLFRYHSPSGKFINYTHKMNRSN